VLGEGGYVPAPARFLQELRAFCAEHHILFVADEVQTGFGRTGRLWCFEHAGITPDIIIMAKGLGSGVPISAVGASRALMERWSPGSHGGTYGGGALATAAALETVRVMQEEALPGNAARMGDYLMNGLRELQAEYPVMGDVRGRGLMVGVEFRRGREPDKATTKAVQAACLERKLGIFAEALAVAEGAAQAAQI
jgi:4-aminobutyrate aminotransferase